MEVVLGGTFDPVHDGHRALFTRAFELGNVTIGLTSDELANQSRYRDRYVRPYEERLRDLRTELKDFAERYERTYEIRKLTDPTGIADEQPFDVLIVSPETKEGGEKINDIREERGLAPLQIEVVPHERAEDGGIISSTRITRGEIDEHGNLTPDAEPRRPRASE